MKKKIIISAVLLAALALGGCGSAAVRTADSVSSPVQGVQTESGTQTDPASSGEKAASVSSESGTDTSSSAVSREPETVSGSSGSSLQAEPVQTSSRQEAASSEEKGIKDNSTLVQSLTDTLTSSAGQVYPGSAGSSMRRALAEADMINWAHDNNVKDVPEDEMAKIIAEAFKQLGENEENVKAGWNTLNCDSLISGEEDETAAARDAGVDRDVLDAFSGDSSYKECWEAFKEAFDKSGVNTDTSDGNSEDY